MQGNTFKVFSCFYNGLALNTVAIDGEWNHWSEWTVCSRGCNSGKQTRHRFCNQPFAKNGGSYCNESRFAEQACNTEACPGK